MITSMYNENIHSLRKVVYLHHTGLKMNGVRYLNVSGVLILIKNYLSLKSGLLTIIIMDCPFLLTNVTLVFRLISEEN